MNHRGLIAVQDRRKVHENLRRTSRTLICIVSDRIAVLTKVRAAEWKMLEHQVRRNIA
jgi:hypothetical protein